MWGMLAAVGLASDGSQPDMGVAWPLKTLEKLEEADELTEKHASECLATVMAKDWEIVSTFKDPEAGGDMHMWSKAAIGRYQMVKVTLTLQNTTCEAVLDFALSEELETRKEFSGEINKLDILAKTEKASVQHMAYNTPPGVANREFIVLAGQKQLDESTWMGYGCSVDHPKFPELNTPVRGATQFCWHVTQVGDHVMVNWFNCFDPRGWTPSFLLAWMKGAVTNEFVNIRACLAGKKVEVKQTSLDDVGVSEADAKAQRDAAEKAGVAK